MESYTEGVDVPSKIVLEQKHLAAGDQIPVEVAISVEEGYTGSLNIGWSVEYEYTTAFLTGENDRNGSLQKKTVREDAGNYLELQYGTGRMEGKDTGAENPYLEPSQGQPLEDNKMFLSVNNKLYSIDKLDSVCDDDYYEGVLSAQTFADMIKKLPTVYTLTTADEDKIKEARQFYDAMTDSQKSFVSADTVKSLEKLEERLQALKDAEAEAGKDSTDDTTTSDDTTTATE